MLLILAALVIAIGAAASLAAAHLLRANRKGRIVLYGAVLSPFVAMGLGWLSGWVVQATGQGWFLWFAVLGGLVGYGPLIAIEMRAGERRHLRKTVIDTF